MSEVQWNAFKRHFAPGKYGEFIEHHLAGRKSYCRVRDVSVMSIVPFQEEKTLFGEKVLVNIYKGSCSISFEWDEPYHYSTVNVISEQDWQNNRQASIRAMYANSTPRYNSWNKTNPCCIGDDIYSLNGNGGLSEDVDIEEANTFNFYNPSTIFAKCKLSFKFKWLTSSIGTTPFYLNSIGDTINGELYNSVEVCDKNGNVINSIRYTSPDVIYQTNKAIKLAAEYYNNNAIYVAIDFEELLREEITNSKVMGWAANAIRAMIHENSGDGYIVGRYSDTSGQLLKHLKDFYIFSPSGETVKK